MFGGASSVWSKAFELTPTKIVLTVPPEHGLPAEEVLATPDNLIYNPDGTDAGTVKDLVGALLHAPFTVREFGKLGNVSHKGFSLEWNPATLEAGEYVCLLKLDPPVLRRVAAVIITGNCNFDISEFGINNGVLGNISIAWGSGSMFGKEALLVASETEASGRKISITTATQGSH